MEDNGYDDEIIRRLIRERKKLVYLDDYILLVELDGERFFLFINDELWDNNEVKDNKVWRDVCEDEIEFIVKNKIWELVEFFVGVKVIGFK